MFTEQAATAATIERTGWRLYHVGAVKVDLHGWQCGCGGTADRECQHIRLAVVWADRQLQATAASGLVSRREADHYYAGAYHKLYAASFGW